MIAVDSSVVIAYIQGDKLPEVMRFEEALDQFLVVLPPTVIAEVLSDSYLPAAVEEKLLALPVLEILPGYWPRVGKMRAQLRAKGLKARLADAQIAQSCIDYTVPLITADNDFRHFANNCGLTLA